MSQPPVPFLNRLVDQMLEHADPRADQNIWNLARAAEEVMRQSNVERFFETGDPSNLTNAPDSKIASIIAGDPDAQGPDLASRVQAMMNAKYETEKEKVRLHGIVSTADTELSRIGRTYAHGPLEQRLVVAIRQAGSSDKRLDRAESQLRSLAHILSPKTPIDVAGRPIVSAAEALMSELTELRSKVASQEQQIEGQRQALQGWKQVAGELVVLIQGGSRPDGVTKEVLSKVLSEWIKSRVDDRKELKDTLAHAREILDPDDRLENELLTGIAEHRMNELAEWRRGERTARRVEQPGRYVAELWDNSAKPQELARYAVKDTRTGEWATGDVGEQADAEEIAAAWNRGER